MRILRGVAEENDGYNEFLTYQCQDQVTLPLENLSHLNRKSASGRQWCLLTMSQVMPYPRYPGGCSAFFTDLHLEFPRWLRLVALVPLIHASIEGLSYEDLCFHLLGIFPFSNPPNVLIASADRIRSSVAEMLFKEPFFIVRLPPPCAVPPILTIQYRAHFGTMGRRCQPLAGFMNLLSTLTRLESRLPSISYDA